MVVTGIPLPGTDGILNINPSELAELLSEVKLMLVTQEDRNVVAALESGEPLSGMHVRRMSQATKDLIAEKAVAQPGWSNTLVPVQIPNGNTAWVLHSVAKDDGLPIMELSF